ncbi:hypothetical protein [Enhygromyxa salina]|uniref:hypothetical protein n=1 Tax=Enhygromyxa salina TaxID=215803 RepID=UPI0006978C39|nr:hypothetical protein [Enhygromyxa salina]
MLLNQIGERPCDLVGSVGDLVHRAFNGQVRHGRRPGDPDPAGEGRFACLDTARCETNDPAKPHVVFRGLHVVLPRPLLEPVVDDMSPLSAVAVSHHDDVAVELRCTTCTRPETIPIIGGEEPAQHADVDHRSQVGVRCALATDADEDRTVIDHRVRNVFVERAVLATVAVVVEDDGELSDWPFATWVCGAVDEEIDAVSVDRFPLDGLVLPSEAHLRGVAEGLQVVEVVLGWREARQCHDVELARHVLIRQ